MERADSLNRSAILGVTAAFLLIGGFILTSWGQSIFGSHLDNHLWLKAALVRIFGTIVMADGCFAAALAQADPRSQRRGIKWFALGHGLVLLMLCLQRLSTLDAGPVDVAINSLSWGTAIFAAVWFSADGLVQRPLRTVLSVFGSRQDQRPLPEAAWAAEIRKAAAQEERNRLARDLHDSVKQQLFVIQTAAATAQIRSGKDDEVAREALEQVRTSTREAMTEMEAMLDQLRATPLGNEGLVAALRRQGEALQHRTGAVVTVKVGLLPDPTTVQPGAQEALYRVAQEALSNAARHARAKTITVQLDTLYNNLLLRIEDDGVGFSPGAANAGMGLRNMRTRLAEVGGDFELSSLPASGTTILARVPVNEVVGLGEYRRNTLIWVALTLMWGLTGVFSVRRLEFGQIMLVALFGINAVRSGFAWAHARRPLT